MEFLLVSAYTPNGNESGANRMRKLALGLRAHGHQAEWLGPEAGFKMFGASYKLRAIFHLTLASLAWARRHPNGWLLVSLPPPWLLWISFVLATFFPSRLLLDFRDPILNQEVNPRSRIYRAVIWLLQGWSIRRAHEMILAAPGIGDFFPSRKGKALTVLAGLDEQETRRLHALPQRRDCRKIIYGGSFYGTRSPGPLLDALAAYRGDLRFELYVSFNDPRDRQKVVEQIERLNLKGSVFLADQLPRAEFLLNLRGAGGGLVITHSHGSEYAIPGKIFDYLSAGVLPWVVTEDSGLKNFLDLYGLNCVVTSGWSTKALLEGLETVSRKLAESSDPVPIGSLQELFEAKQVEQLVRELGKVEGSSL